LLILDADSISNMKTLSFWESVCLVFYSGWLNLRFYHFPTEKNLLISFWYDHAFYRDSEPGDTVYNFLDRRVRALGEKIANPERKKGVRNLERYLQEALHREGIRRKIVDFLESPSPEENYRPVMEAIRSAWRMEDEVRVATGVEAPMTEIGSEMNELKVEERGDEDERDGHELERPLNARAYIIAVQLWFELEGRELEFDSFSRYLPDLKSFIRERFRVKKLPGRLEEFKGYSYKSELNGRNRSKRGQLRIPFRQIMEHPEVFGEGVSARARAMLKQYFPDR
jgi:hypothetical protein